MTTRRQRSRRPKREPAWVGFDDEKLLGRRMNQLALRIAGSRLEAPIEQLYDELAQRGLCFRPRVWLGSEWFSPDGVPGIGIPFYLAHPRLMRLEQKQMLDVEGGKVGECMRILRHEAGHAIDSAYRLHRRKRWRQFFGRFSAPYPDYYHPKPFTQNYVLHLGWWYAQAHPAEDFAETFAVWLTPNARWRQHYRGWGALEKLQYVEALMSEIAGVRPPVRARITVEPVSKIRTTLRQHYRRKRIRYGEDWPDFYDRQLRRLFSDDRKFARRPTAASFLRSIRTDLRRLVAHWTGEYQYTIDQVLLDMIDRCRELKLRLTRSGRQVRMEAIVMVTMQTMNYLHSGHHRLAL